MQRDPDRDPAPRRLLISRLRHLLLTEGYGNSGAGVSIGKPLMASSRTGLAIISLGPAAIPWLVEELPDIQGLVIWPTFRALIEAGGEAQFDVSELAPPFDEPSLDPRSSDLPALIDQLWRRLLYLLEQEFIAAPMPHLVFSRAMQSLRTLDYEAYLLEAFLDSTNPLEKGLLRFTLSLRGVAREWKQGDDAWWLEHVAQQIALHPGILRAASPAQLDRFKAAGIIPPDFERRLHPPDDEPTAREPDDEPAISYALAGGRFLVHGRFPGSVAGPHPGSTLDVGTDGASGQAVLVTKLFVLSHEPLPRVEQLRLAHEGVAPLLFLDRVELSEGFVGPSGPRGFGGPSGPRGFGGPSGPQGLANVLVEALPDARRCDTPLPAPEALRIANKVAQILARVHAAGEQVVGLRPQLTFVDADEQVTLVPRGELLRRLSWPSGPKVEGQLPPFEDIYLAPELLMGRAPTPASDVFSLCAMLVSWLTGEHPFARASFYEHFQAIVFGPPNCSAVPDSLRATLSRGLAADPDRRPTLAELRRSLA